MKVIKIKKSRIRKKYIKRSFLTYVFVHSLLLLLMVGLGSFLFFSAKNQKFSKSKSLSEKFLCGNGGVRFDGLCWLPVPNAAQYAQQAKFCAENNFKIASSRQLSSAASELLLMGILPLQESLWTSDSKPCSSGKLNTHECRVLLSWSQATKNQSIVAAKKDSAFNNQESFRQKNLIPETYNTNFKAICVGEALSDESKKIQVFVPVVKDYN